MKNDLSKKIFSRDKVTLYIIAVIYIILSSLFPL